MAREIYTSFEESFGKIEPGAATYLVIVTRGHKDDMHVLRWAVGTSPRYIGMIGSKRKVLSVYRALEKDGIAPEKFAKRARGRWASTLARLHPKEIAISITAELIAIRRGRHKSLPQGRESRKRQHPHRWREGACLLAAVILSAGASSRMGRPKALLSLPRRNISRTSDSSHATLAHWRDSRRARRGRGKRFATIAKLDTSLVVVNPRWEQGQLSSIARDTKPGGHRNRGDRSVSGRSIRS